MKIEQKTFVLLLIKHRYFLGHLVEQQAIVFLISGNFCGERAVMQGNRYVIGSLPLGVTLER